MSGGQIHSGQMNGGQGSSGQGPVAVIGGGIAGLVAARQLVRQGFEVELYEASGQVAGMAQTEHDEDGFSYDLGAHFVTNRLAAAVGVGAWRTVRRYGEVVHLDGAYASYPFGLLRRPELVWSAVRGRLNGSDGPALDAATWFRRAYGEALADRVALPLLQAWSGRPADQLAAAVGEKLPSGMVGPALLRASSRLTRRAVAIGYCREQPQSSAVFHVSPEGGVMALCTVLAAQLGSRVRLHSPVERVVVDDGRVRAITVGGRSRPVAAVVSTIPINRLADVVEGAPQLERFRRFQYRPLRALNLKMDGRGLLPDTLTWTPEGFSFFRLSEATWSMPWLAPPGKTMVLVELSALPGEEDWVADDAAITAKVLEELRPLIPDAASRCIGVRMQYLPLAYPVFALDYEAERQALERDGVGIDNLCSIGRNGEFAHILMEDSYWRTVAAMTKLGASLRAYQPVLSR